MLYRSTLGFHAALWVMVVAGQARGDYIYSFFATDGSLPLQFSTPVPLTPAATDPLLALMPVTLPTLPAGVVLMEPGTIPITFEVVPKFWARPGMPYTEQFYGPRGPGLVVPPELITSSSGFALYTFADDQLYVTFSGNNPEQPGLYQITASSLATSGDPEAPGAQVQYDELRIATTDPVPEPSALILAITGLVLLALRVGLLEANKAALRADARRPLESVVEA
jgi:hypothetical protein